MISSIVVALVEHRHDDRQQRVGRHEPRALGKRQGGTTPLCDSFGETHELPNVPQARTSGNLAVSLMPFSNAASTWLHDS